MMLRPSLLTLCVVLPLVVGCGEPVGAVHSQPALHQVFANPAELLELESLATRQALFRQVTHTARRQAGAVANGLVLFPVLQSGEYRAAPGMDERLDLLQGTDGGEPALLELDLKSGEAWPEERRDSLQGLSEREVAELVARSLMTGWRLQPHGRVRVERASGVPYAAAYVDGVLRINPAFLYLAAASSGS